jgi:hypothetical protein
MIAFNVICFETILANDFSALRKPGLPDGFFSNQIYKFGQILEGLRWENVDIYFRVIGNFYGYLGYFMTIWYISCSFGTLFLVLVSCT